MEQRQTANLTTTTTTEFASDAIELLARTVRQAICRTGPATGTGHLLSTLLDDSENPGDAGPPASGSPPRSAARSARGTQHWARDDSGPIVPADGSEAPDDAYAPDDAIEVAAAWREALWVAGNSSKTLREEGTERPRPTGALREAQRLRECGADPAALRARLDASLGAASEA